VRTNLSADLQNGKDRRYRFAAAILRPKKKQSRDLWTGRGENRGASSALTRRLTRLSHRGISPCELPARGEGRGGGGRGGRDEVELASSRPTARRFKVDGPPYINHPNNRAVPPADSPKRIYILHACTCARTGIRASVRFVRHARISHALFRSPETGCNHRARARSPGFA